MVKQILILLCLIYSINYCNSAADKSYCTNCSLNTISLSQGSLMGEQPSIPKGIQTVRKCKRITVVCDTKYLPGAFVFMNFNNSGKGPLKNFLPKVKATLKCFNTHWCYIEKNYTTPVFEIECHQGYHKNTNVDFELRNQIEDAFAMI